MATTLRSTAGTKVYVSTGVPATNNTAGYAALTWTEVQGFSSIGEIGDRMGVGTFEALVEGVMKFRTLSDPGTIEASMSDMPADPGQILMKAAFTAARGSAAEILSLRIEDASGKGTYSRTKVASWVRVYGGANDVQMRNATLPIEAGTVVEF